MYADLHVHTNVSDGASTPAKVVHLATLAKLTCISITDHDTMEGIGVARKEAINTGVEVLSGVELSTEINCQEVHILGYCVEPDNELFKDHLSVFQKARLQRVHKIITKLRNLGINISFEDVIKYAGSSAVGRPHIAKSLLNKGIVNSISEAFENYIGLGKPAFEPRFKYHPLKMINLVKMMGGVPVLAHPGISCNQKMLISLIKGGLQGMEVYHPHHTTEMERFYLGLCNKYGLLATGGSDFHGIGIANHGRLGESVVTYNTVIRLKELAKQNCLLTKQRHV